MTDAAPSFAPVEDAGSPVAACPKRMVYGPCGGVRAGGGCELGDRRCPFVDMALVTWSGPPPPAPAREPLSRLGQVAGAPVIVTDLRVRPFDLASVAAVTARLARDANAVLVGEHHARPDHPPVLLATAIADAGGRAWVTLTGRDRNRVVLESELIALAALDVAGVHCVTGDARAPSVRPDATQVFDLDGTRLAALARHLGHAVSVAATPVAPPVELRARRVVEKQRAGAQLCFVNHAGGPDAVGRFVTAAREAGATLGFVPCVSVFTDHESFQVLERFPGLVIDAAVRAAVLGAGDPRTAGIDAAVAQARRMLAIPGVVGVNLSGAATGGSELDGAAIMAEVAGRIRAA